MESDRSTNVFEPSYTYFSMGRLFVELEECLLLFEGDQKIDLTILQLANLEDGFNDIFDIDVNFGVGILSTITSNVF